MGIPRRVKKRSELQYTTEKPKGKTWKFVLGLVLSVIVLGIIIVIIRNNVSVGEGGSKISAVPWWVVLLAFAFILYLVVYFGWKAKNWFIEYIMSMMYGLLIMTIILLIGYDRILGSVSIEWLKTLLGSLFVGSGGVFLGLLVKVLIKPLFNGLKKTFLFEAR